MEGEVDPSKDPGKTGDHGSKLEDLPRQDSWHLVVMASHDRRVLLEAVGERPEEAAGRALRVCGVLLAPGLLGAVGEELVHLAPPPALGRHESHGAPELLGRGLQGVDSVRHPRRPREQAQVMHGALLGHFLRTRGHRPAVVAVDHAIHGWHGVPSRAVARLHVELAVLRLGDRALAAARRFVQVVDGVPPHVAWLLLHCP
mmetsp:Transcript_130038/g.404508  ORF Transcript_130038/g.404508 Transcript_130038/m.404508 type:complete len:201 (-) Transcript_130038:1122-1724(-)